MHWIFKMHKNPVGVHFILASKFESKFINLSPMILSSYTYQIVVSFESYKKLISSFNH